MRRSGIEYERMARLAINVIMDYGICEFPVDMDKLIRKMGINLIPYSVYGRDSVEILLKRSKDGFYLPRSDEFEATILYNDDLTINTKARIESTKGHEIKHILEGDLDDEEDDLADYFSKYLRCPIPYAIHLKIRNELELISKFGLSNEQAGIVIKNINTRKKAFGNKIFDYEAELIEYLKVNEKK